MHQAPVSQPSPICKVVQGVERVARAEHQGTGITGKSRGVRVGGGGVGAKEEKDLIEMSKKNRKGKEGGREPCGGV